MIDGVDLCQGLFEVGVEGEVQEDGEGEGLDRRGAGPGEGEDGGDGLGGLGEEVSVVGAELGEGGEGLEGISLGLDGLRLSLG